MNYTKQGIKKYSALKMIDYGDLSNGDFHRLSRFIFKGFGIKLPEQKKVLLKSRLIKRLKELKMENYSQYIDFVLEDSDRSREEVINMIDVVSTNKTEFFRENAHFDILSRMIIPGYAEKRKKYLKCWSAGCSTGEEVYTLCMVLEEQKRKAIIDNYLVYGSDISVTALKKAVKAIYPFTRVEQIPLEYRKKYLLKSKAREKRKIRIVKELREKTKFMRINLVDDFYPIVNDFDVIFCRNTLIYFDRMTQIRVVNNLLRHLNLGGYLFIGHSESLLNHNIRNIRQVQPTVYQKVL
jgi:chemotaxis protein methyltransferase CheR